LREVEFCTFLDIFRNKIAEVEVELSPKFATGILGKMPSTGSAEGGSTSLGAASGTPTDFTEIGSFKSLGGKGCKPLT
jgi:hypothetical protein